MGYVITAALSFFSGAAAMFIFAAHELGGFIEDMPINEYEGAETDEREDEDLRIR